MADLTKPIELTKWMQDWEKKLPPEDYAHKLMSAIEYLMPLVAKLSPGFEKRTKHLYFSFEIVQAEFISTCRSAWPSLGPDILEFLALLEKTRKAANLIVESER